MTTTKQSKELLKEFRKILNEAKKNPNAGATVSSQVTAQTKTATPGDSTITTQQTTAAMTLPGSIEELKTRVDTLLNRILPRLEARIDDLVLVLQEYQGKYKKNEALDKVIEYFLDKVEEASPLTSSIVVAPSAVATPAPAQVGAASDTKEASDKTSSTKDKTAKLADSARLALVKTPTKRVVQALGTLRLPKGLARDKLFGISSPILVNTYTLTSPLIIKGHNDKSRWYGIGTGISSALFVGSGIAFALTLVQKLFIAPVQAVGNVGGAQAFVFPNALRQSMPLFILAVPALILAIVFAVSCRVEDAKVEKAVEQEHKNSVSLTA